VMQDLIPAAPEQLGLDPIRLAPVAELLEQAAVQGAYPGAVALVARYGRVALHVAVGRLRPDGPPMQPQTVFDLASMTKPLVTGSLCVALLERGQLHLQDTVGYFFPDKQLSALRDATLQQLLTHTSGLPPAARACPGPLRSREDVMSILDLALEATP